MLYFQGARQDYGVYTVKNFAQKDVPIVSSSAGNADVAMMVSGEKTALQAVTIPAL